MVKIVETRKRKNEFDRLVELAGEQISLCMQCGTCSGSCPNVQDMDHTPRLLMHLAQLGLIEQVLSSQTIWTCSSCLQCAARCPRGIDLAKVMEALRALKLRQREGQLDPKQVADPVLKDAPPVLVIAAMRKLVG